MAPSGGKKNELKRTVQWEHMAAGLSGGVVSTLALHPLDLIKVRFQVNEGIKLDAAILAGRPQYRGILDAFVQIHRKEGIRGLYQGITPNVWGAGASWGFYFLFYNALKSRQMEKDGVESLSPGQHMIAAAQAGIGTLVLTNPIWVAKTRLCLQYDSASTKGSTHYKGMADCLTKMYKAEGIRGLYKGFLPGIFGVSHGALQFMAYEEMKKSYNSYKKVPVNTKFNSIEYLTFAALSKIFAACSTYPYQVVRSRLQDQHRNYAGIWDVIHRTWVQEGPLAFYKGLGPSLLRVTPACCITFLVYENMIAYLIPTS